MNGNWYGTYTGTNSGRLVVEVDDRGDHFEGWAYAFDSSVSLPSTAALIKTSNKDNRLQFKTTLLPIDPRTNEPANWQQIAGLYQVQVSVPKEAEVDCEWSAQQLSLRWKTDIGTFGSAELPKSEITSPSSIEPLPIASWHDFKGYVTKLEPYRYVFRGQANPWRLRTPFHRTGRGDMRRFFMDDVPALHRHLSALTPHIFDLANALENAAFLNLVQHHGYPTPLLDWTYSPFVGAYFAFARLVSDTATDTRKARIFIFDRVQWCADIQQILSVSVRWPHFSIVEPVAIGNERLIPQQALSSYTTVDDIETYIRSRESGEKRYLQVVELPASARTEIMRELRMMGLTAGSLFPGLDGVCEELKGRFFGSNYTRDVTAGTKP